jgi:DNA repair protein RadC
MKVVIGKFSSEPFHALSKKEISLLLKLVPNEWIEQLSTVVLSSKILKKTKLVKPVEYVTTSKQLSIYSRGLVREDIARHVLLELASINLEQKQANYDKTAELEEVIKPYMDKFLKARV